MFSFTFFGYAAVLIHFEKHLLFDPGVVNGDPLVDLQMVHASYVLVSHTHIEHLGNAVDFANDKGSVILGNSQVCDFVRKEGAHGYAFAQLEDQQTMDIGANIHIIGYRLQHGGFLAPQNMAFLVQSNQGSVLHLGHAKEYAPLKNSNPDLLCVPVAGKKKGTFTPEEAITATLAIQPRYVLPISGNESQTKVFLVDLAECDSNIAPVSLTPNETFTLV